MWVRRGAAAAAAGGGGGAPRFRQLWRVLAPERPRLYGALGVLLVSTAATLSVPRFFGATVDAFRGGEAAGGAAEERTAAALRLAADKRLWVAAVIAAGAGASGFRLFILNSAAERIAYRLRLSVFRKLLAREAAFFDARAPGALVSQLVGDVATTAHAFLDISSGVRNAVTVAASAAAVACLAPSGLVGAGFALPVAGLFSLALGYGRIVRAVSAGRQARLADAAETAEEVLGALKVVRQFNGEKLEENTFEKKMDLVYAEGWKNAVASGGQAAVFYLCGGGLLLHLVYQCGSLVAVGAASLGDVTSLMMYATMLGASAQGVVKAYGDLQKAMGACERLLEYVEPAPGAESVEAAARPSFAAGAHARPAHPTPAPGSSPSPFIHPSPPLMAFENVSFAYPSRPETLVLRNLSLELPAGVRAMAVVGPSGCGKSSLAALLLRIYDPQAGTIRLDGADIHADRDATWVRNRVALVEQNPTLFRGTVAENVFYGLRAAAALGLRRGPGLTPSLDDLLRRASATELGGRDVASRGANFSGGQRQRLSLARALAVHARLLFLDEATSAVDMQIEREILGALVPKARSGSAESVPEGAAGRKAGNAPAAELAGSTAGVAGSAAELAGSAVDLARSAALPAAATAPAAAIPAPAIIFVTHRLDLLDKFELVAVMSTPGVVDQVGEPADLMRAPGRTLAQLLERGAGSYKADGPGGLGAQELRLATCAAGG